MFQAFQEAYISHAYAALDDPTLFPNHFTHGVPESLKRLQSETQQLLDTLGNLPDVDRATIIDDLRRVAFAIEIYEEAKACGLDSYLSADLLINDVPTRARWFGLDAHGNPLRVQIEEGPGRWADSESPEILDMIRTRFPVESQPG